MQLTNEPDKFSWALTNSGIFMVRSLYLDLTSGYTVFLKKYIWKMDLTMIKIHTSGSEVLRCFDTKGFALTKPLSWVSRRQFHSMSSSSTLVAARMITFLHLICKGNTLSWGNLTSIHKKKKISALLATITRHYLVNANCRPDYVQVQRD